MRLWERIYNKYDGRYGDLVDAYVELLEKKHRHRWMPTYPGVWECRCGKERTMSEIKERETWKTKNGILDGSVSGTRNQKKPKK